MRKNEEIQSVNTYPFPHTIVRDFLDQAVPISKAKWHQITKFNIEDNKLILIY